MHSKISGLLLVLSVFVCLIFGSQSVYAADISSNQAKATEIKATITSLEEEKSKCVEMKNKAHEMAEEARAKGLSEEGEVISCAHIIWDSNNTREKEIDIELKALKTELEEIEIFANMSYVGDFKLTGYCACKKCCGKSPSSPGYGVTAMGTKATEGRTVAMDKRFAFGTKVYIEGLGVRIVEDRGGAIKGSRIDVYNDTHSGCFAPEYNRIAKVYVINT